MSGNRRQSRVGHGFGFYMGRVRFANVRVFELWNEAAAAKITQRDAMDFNPQGFERTFFSPWTLGKEYFTDHNFEKLSRASAGMRGINGIMRRLGAHATTSYLSTNEQFPEGWPQ